MRSPESEKHVHVHSGWYACVISVAPKIEKISKFSIIKFYSGGGSILNFFIKTAQIIYTGIHKAMHMHYESWTEI